MCKSDQIIAKNYAYHINNGQESIMVWAGIAYNFKTLLVLVELRPSVSSGGEQVSAASLRSKGYAEQILEGPLYTAVQLLPGYKVLEDGAPCHRALLCQQIHECLLWH